MMKKQTGQVIVVLILIMTVALAIGLSIVQKSLVDVSTSTKVEESSRAFSAAEAGIEKALQLNASTTVNFSESNTTADVVDSGLLPAIPTGATRQEPLEYPDLAKERVAHFWLADFNSPTNPPTPFYTHNLLDVYWGNSLTDQAALELTLVYYNGTEYKSQKWYLDKSGSTKNNGFDKTTTCDNVSGRCEKRITFPTGDAMLIRARLLYNTTSQPVAIQAAVGHNLPPQQKVLTSTGASGETQRKVEVRQEPKVVPPYLDFAIFSAGEISK